MGRHERRQRDKETLRGRILEAARELFAESGYEAVTMRRVAAKIDYSPTTIYLHFQDKESLVRELCSEDFLSLAQCFGVRPGAMPTPWRASGPSAWPSSTSAWSTRTTTG